jgi:hypothetical protein
VIIGVFAYRSTGPDTSWSFAGTTGSGSSMVFELEREPVLVAGERLTLAGFLNECV